DGKLPVSDQAQVKREAVRLIKQHRAALLKVVGLFVLAAVAGLAGPALLRVLIDDISAGTTLEHVMLFGFLLIGFVLLQAVLQRFAVASS
ncbi:hypothetical protein LXJ57_25700, partial [Escherichia coli]|nr:hypothetical protein [Escherichia coli]